MGHLDYQTTSTTRSGVEEVQAGEFTSLVLPGNSTGYRHCPDCIATRQVEKQDHYCGSGPHDVHNTIFYKPLKLDGRCFGAAYFRIGLVAIL